MKKTIGVLATYASAAVLAVSFATVNEVKAQTPASTPAAAQGECSAESKLAWYNEFVKIRNSEQDKAYGLAKKYLACPTNPGEETYVAYLRDKFVAPIDKARRPDQVKVLVYEKKDYVKAFELGRQVLADDPENLRVLIDLGYAGYPLLLAKNETYSAESLGYARKAIAAIESGKAPENWVPYLSKDDTLTYLYNAIGQLTLKSNPSESLTKLIKAAQFESELKKDPWIYVFIAVAYETGPYNKLSAEYKLKFEGKDETPESKLALENINQVVDRMVDAYARAVALAGNNAKYQTNKAAWVDALTIWYKYRHKDSDAGLPEMIASATAKPLPPEPTPITTLPSTTPSTSVTPASSGTGTGVGTGAAPAASKPLTTPAAGSTVAAPKPTIPATPAGAKPKPTIPASPAAVVKPTKPKNNHPKTNTRRGH